MNFRFLKKKRSTVGILLNQVIILYSFSNQQISFYKQDGEIRLVCFLSAQWPTARYESAGLGSLTPTHMVPLHSGWLRSGYLGKHVEGKL